MGRVTSELFYQGQGEFTSMGPCRTFLTEGRVHPRVLTTPPHRMHSSLLPQSNMYSFHHLNYLSLPKFLSVPVFSSLTLCAMTINSLPIASGQTAPCLSPQRSHNLRHQGTLLKYKFTGEEFHGSYYYSYMLLSSCHQNLQVAGVLPLSSSYLLLGALTLLQLGC